MNLIPQIRYHCDFNIFSLERLEKGKAQNTELIKLSTDYWSDFKNSNYKKRLVWQGGSNALVSFTTSSAQSCLCQKQASKAFLNHLKTQRILEERLTSATFLHATRWCY